MSRHFALMLVAIALAMLTILAVRESRPINAGLPLARNADYPLCVTVNNGPIQRPDHYSSEPHGRKVDVA